MTPHELAAVAMAALIALEAALLAIEPFVRKMPGRKK